MISYYQWRRTDEEMQADMPALLLYEVDVDRDNVLRMVEVFADGSVSRNSLEIEARHGQRWESLSDGPFVENLGDMDLSACAAEEFQNIWERGKDTPCWNVPGNEIPPSS